MYVLSFFEENITLAAHSAFSKVFPFTYEKTCFGRENASDLPLTNGLARSPLAQAVLFSHPT